MTAVQRNDIPYLHSADPAFFARWLIGGLETLHTTGRGFAGFRGAAAFVGATADTSEDLRDIHNCLEPDERAAFRAGVARGLGCSARLLTDPRAIGICNTLLIVAQRLEADEVLDVLPGFASFVLRLERTDAIDELMDRVLLTASEVTTAGSRAADCLRMIIGLGRFRPPMAYAALIALCKAEPGRLGRHLRQLHRSLDKAFGYTKDHDKITRREVERRELIAEVFDIVSQEDFFLATDEILASSQHDNAVTWRVFTEWWRNDSFRVPEVADKYADLLSDGRFMLDEEDDDQELSTSADPDGELTMGSHQGSTRSRIGELAAAARQAMPGIDLVPESVEQAEESAIAEAA